MNNSELIRKLAGVIDLALESSSRSNAAKPVKYWYPLSLASYGSEEILEALDSLCAFRTTMWEKTRAFEEAFAEHQGGGHAVMVNSGSSADLLLAFALADPRGQRLSRGDEVLIPAVTWPTQIWSCMMAGLRVRLVDVDPSTLNVSIEALEAAVGPRTKAISLVHLLGNPCDLDAVLALAAKHNLFVLEDCCEALGSTWRGKKVGTFGLGAAFSFFFSHHITTMEGGMITTADAALADELRILRAHGWLRNVQRDSSALAGFDVDPRYAFVNWGFNVRPTELQAGFGLQQLLKLPAFEERRRVLAHRFFSYLAETEFFAAPVVHGNASVSWMALPFMIRPSAPFTRDDVAAYLEANGVETRPIVAGNLAMQPAACIFPELCGDSLPGAVDVHRNGLYVGLSPMTSDAEMSRLIETFAALRVRGVQTLA